MMFRELRESIQSEEDAAAVIRISRAREFKVKGPTTRGTEVTGKCHRDLPPADRRSVLAFSSSYSLESGA